ncbi:hypothetical protein GCM10010409_41540 [Mycolicibacterium diernhoferi]
MLAFGVPVPGTISAVAASATANDSVEATVTMTAANSASAVVIDVRAIWAIRICHPRVGECVSGFPRIVAPHELRGG